jgi:hypothetical protein
MMKHGRSKTRSFILFGGFVFLLMLSVNSCVSFRGPNPDHFFTTIDEIPRRLPFSIVAGVICGLLYAFLGSRNHDASG